MRARPARRAGRRPRRTAGAWVGGGRRRPAWPVGPRDRWGERTDAEGTLPPVYRTRAAGPIRRGSEIPSAPAVGAIGPVLRFLPVRPAPESGPGRRPAD